MASPRPTWRRRAFVDWRYIPTESRRAYRMALILFWSVLLAFLIHRYALGVGIVTDVSMRPTLREGNYFLINKYIYRFTPPQRGDVVVVEMERAGLDPYVKRVVGLEREILLIRGGQVFINGQPLVEPYARGPTTPALGPHRIPRGHYFVLGDNRPGSYDSRRFGNVPRRRIVGKIKPGEWFPFW